MPCSLDQVKFVAHFSARVLGLILIPVAVYMFSFYLHFAILNTSGPGDAQMSSLFQSQLQGNEFHKNPVDVAYYSKVTLKNNGYAGGLLHSHVQTYPYGSKQQQVTCYHHKDTNNEWIIKFPRDGVYPDEEPATPRLLRDGDLIRLFHDQTGRNLHSHHHAAPVTKADLEVSGYGNETIGDMNDYWLVEIVDDVAVSGGDDSSNHVRSLTTRFRLKHKTFNCYLRSHDIHLPEWGFKQAEVTCDKRLRQDDNNLWNIEQHWNDKSKLNYYNYVSIT